MKSIDVKQIIDIPNLEKFLDDCFHLMVYEVEDKLQIYRNTPETIELTIHSDENTIFQLSNLSDLITQDNIEYFSFSYIDAIKGEMLKSFAYRPLIPEKEKNYGDN